MEVADYWGEEARMTTSVYSSGEEAEAEAEAGADEEAGKQTNRGNRYFCCKFQEDFWQK